jgi:hypothetical protein
LQVHECVLSCDVDKMKLPSIEEYCLDYKPCRDWKLLVEPRVVLDQLDMFTMADL